MMHLYRTHLPNQSAPIWEVLILVVMDDALVPKRSVTRWNVPIVLILVVMDDALVLSVK